MEMTLDRAEWRDETLTATSFPTPLALTEPGMNALVVPPPPPAEPDAPPKRGGARHAIPALLVVGWGGLFAYCATYLREDLPFRPLTSAEASRRAEEPPRRVTVLPELPPEAAPAALHPTETPALAAALPAPAPVQAIAPKRAAPATAEYVGTWGPTPAACLSPSRRRGYLPATISADRARAGKTTCTFHDGHRTGNAWVMAAECSDRGRRWSSQVRLLVDGDRLTWTSSKGSSTYVRCGRRAG